MAIAYDAAGGSVGTATPTNATATHTHTMGSVSNGIAFVAIVNQNTGGLSSVTFGGNAMTLVGSKQSTGSTIVYLYVILAPSSGANTVSVTRNTTTNYMFVMSTSYSGASQTTTPDATTSGNGSGTSHTGTLSTVADNCWTILAAEADNDSMNASTGSTRRVNSSGYQGLFDSNGAKTPAGSTSMSVTHSSSNYVYFMASFAPGGTAHTKELSETATFTDSVLKTPGKVLSESATHTDLLIRSTSRTLSETGTFTDTALTVKTQPVTLSESATFTDSIVKTPGKVLSETGTFTESLERVLAYIRDLSEEATFTDTPVVNTSRSILFSETAAFTDTVLKKPGKVLAETALFIDAAVSFYKYPRGILRGKSAVSGISVGSVGSPALGKSSSSNILNGSRV